jgi:hypothetical protein
MTDKMTRHKRTSSGVRKNRGPNSGRKSPVVADAAGLNFIRHQVENRWPTEETLIKAHELAIDRKANRHSSTKKIRPMDTGFLLLDGLIGTCPKALAIVLTAAALKIKRVRRYPGWVLQRTYNLKNRVIEII